LLREAFNPKTNSIQVGILDTKRSHGYNGESAQTNDATTKMSEKMDGAHLTDKNSLDFHSAHHRSHKKLNSPRVTNDYNPS